MTRPTPDRRAAGADITVPCRLVSFAQDLVAPPVYGRELADTIPGATFELVDVPGHSGYL
ncbi:alpha/beta fold hydrolase [Streptomyces sp. NPDC055025]